MPPPQPYLPTRDRIPFPEDVDVAAVGATWLTSFADAIASRDVSAIQSCVHPDGWWRDIFALTWDLRTFHGSESIRTFLTERLVGTSDEIQLKIDPTKLQEAVLVNTSSDIRWIRVQFPFTTRVAQGQAVVHLVPSSPSHWQAFILATHLLSLTNHPERIGPLRSFAPNHGKWQEERRKALAFEDSEPEVLIVGAGHSGLGLAARLQSLGVKTLVADQKERVGDNWRERYEALCLQNAVWYNHFPYLDFPPTFPVYIPSRKLADWMEHYANALELNVWTSTLVTSATRDESSGKWNVEVTKLKTGEKRVFKVDHVVFALGFGGGKPHFPEYPGRDVFKGQVLHSSEHKTAKDHIGKKVVVVGACTSGHDVASDFAEHGVDVTLFQRSSTYIMSIKEGMPRVLKPIYWEGGPPIDTADLLANSLPTKFNKLLSVRTTSAIAQADQKLLDDLHAIGYRTNSGEDGSGWVWLALNRGGGYYLEVGSCQKLIDGQIKLKNDAQLAGYTPTGLLFDDGSKLDGDVVLFATGFGDGRDIMRPIVGDAVADKMPPVWGLNEEGEMHGVWRELGTEGLWYMTGNFAWSRFFSKHVALQIKAKLVGEFGTQYSASRSGSA